MASFKTKTCTFKDNEAYLELSSRLKKEEVLAFKGSAGFYIIADARSKKAEQKIRELKQRPKKPFAIMVKDLKMARELAHINKVEALMLDKDIKPILLLASREDERKKIGLFLASTKEQKLLFDHIDFPIIATSCNVSSNPIIYNEDPLGLDYFDTEKSIDFPLDDNLAFLVDEDLVFLRMSKFLRPLIYKSSFNKLGCFLALGAEEKSSFAIYKDGLIIVSPPTGDLKNPLCLSLFLKHLNYFIDKYSLKFDLIIKDLHPDFSHNKLFKDYKQVGVQHHFAHALSLMFEYELEEALCFAFDGLGYGSDAQIWGAEVLRCNSKSFERLYHFDYFPLMAKGYKNTQFLAISIIEKYALDATNYYQNFKEEDLESIKKVLSNTKLQTSSLGRIFDAFASIILGLNNPSYEGQSGLEIEELYDASLNISYDFKIENTVITYKEAFTKALKDSKEAAATGFLNGLADLILKLSKDRKEAIILSGGVFQNKTLLSLVIKRFKQEGIKYYLPKNFSINDEALALGQLYYAIKGDFNE